MKKLYNFYTIEEGIPFNTESMLESEAKEYAKEYSLSFKEAITEEKFFAYTKVQESGVTNMLDVRYVSELSGLSRGEILDIIKNYGRYHEKYIKVDN